ncbi:BppU family phage baseplate upper protein [Pediococcus pentosaceus]|uniref:BppU family phage baseplate upper protein n=1 Tax=Pediococcus pentosaceus TaxID=1255 RepID=UPI0018A19F8C|nr:BppU family phage baseplate upper protein [Pediococcus pentosaceus]MBF7129698.1 BppU family phage baseplate upper protein [Pediococcus pentosaceus]MBF7132563.1 BppU family phage baseplate upper protein [Pediococcus pentosaceus]
MEIMTFNIDKDRRNLVDDKQNFSIDFHNSKYNWLQARQYEESMRQVEVHVVHENGSPVDLTGMNPVFEGWLPEGLYRIIDAKHSVMIDAQNGIFRFDFPAPAFQVAGSYKQAFFRLMKDGMSVTTLEFSLDVMADKVISGLVPSDYITPFEDLYGKLQDYITKANGDFDTAMAQWKKDVANLITDLNADVSGINLTITEIKTQLSSLEDKIKADNLLTKADLEKYFSDFKAEIQSGLDEINDFNESIKNLSITDIAGGIPDYMMNTLNSAQVGIDKSKFNLIFATDYHYDIGTDYNPDNIDVPDATIREVWESGLRKVLNATSLSNADAVVFNGDNIDQPMVKDIPLEKKMMLKELHDFLLTATSSAEMPAFILKGNHDVNYNHKVAEMNLTSVITDKEWSQVYDKVAPDYGEKRNDGANYFYKDFDNKKVRLIGLDTYDLPETTNDDGSMKYNRFNTSGLQQAQLNWLANTALQVPKGTTVVISMHHPIDGTLATAPDVTKVINHDVLMQIINDFVAGKSNSISGKVSDVPVKIDYTFKGAGTIAALLSGHFHTDGNVVKNGINFIQTRCSLGSGDNVMGDKRIKEYIGTPLEDAFDIVTIDTTAKTINLKRVGAGSEDARYATRHFNY